MKRTTSILILILAITQHLFAQKTASATIIKELQAAETEMFTSIIAHDPAYFKDYVSDDFVSINADGVTQDKGQTLADSVRGKFLMAFTYKKLDKKIRVYGKTGIITGRAQAFPFL